MIGYSELVGQKVQTQWMQWATAGNVAGNWDSRESGNGLTGPANVTGDTDLYLFVSNRGAGGCTLTITASFDGNFGAGTPPTGWPPEAAQDVLAPGLAPLWNSGTGTNTTRALQNNVIAVAANQSSVWYVQDPYPFYQSAVSAAVAGLNLYVALFGRALS